MHDLGNLVNIANAFHARNLNGSQFLTPRRRKRGSLNYPNQQNGNTTQEQAQGHPHDNPAQPARDATNPALPAERQWGAEHDDPVNRNRVRNMAERARAFGEAMSDRTAPTNADRVAEHAAHYDESTSRRRV